MKITFKPLRNLAGRPVRINNKKAVKVVVKPAAKIGRAVWRGLCFHLRPREDFRKMLDRLATAPFRINLPGFKAGKA
ncbi:MAG TPA: hypothetical protein VMF08_08965 [Candidatus Sulfotelmatobacter sp.]|nr:hypothetical protein [Candidatus Sulfotelmatobacter sp.]